MLPILDNCQQSHRTIYVCWNCLPEINAVLSLLQTVIDNRSSQLMLLRLLHPPKRCARLSHRLRPQSRSRITYQCRFRGILCYSGILHTLKKIISPTRRVLRRQQRLYQRLITPHPHTTVYQPLVLEVLSFPFGIQHRLAPPGASVSSLPVGSTRYRGMVVFQARCGDIVTGEEGWIAGGLAGAVVKTRQSVRLASGRWGERDFVFHGKPWRGIELCRAVRGPQWNNIVLCAVAVDSAAHAW